MEHARKAQPCHLYRERLNFAGPYGCYAVVNRCQRESADAVEEASQRVFLNPPHSAGILAAPVSVFWLRRQFFIVMILLE
jgi:hypothetical protein